MTLSGTSSVTFDISAGYRRGAISVATERVGGRWYLRLRERRPSHALRDMAVTSTRKENLMVDRLIVRGAREHNLKGVDIDVPREALIVFTGLSGSGKSSLAFDTIFAEGQRRYVESLTVYALLLSGQLVTTDDASFAE